MVIVGDAGGQWRIVRNEEAWSFTEPTSVAAATVQIMQDDAWQIFTKRRLPGELLAAFPQTQLAGDRQLGLHVLEMVAVMA